MVTVSILNLISIGLVFTISVFDHWDDNNILACTNAFLTIVSQCMMFYVACSDPGFINPKKYDSTIVTDKYVNSDSVLETVSIAER